MAQNVPTSDLCIICNSANLAKRKYRRNPVGRPKKYDDSASNLKQKRRLEEELLIVPQLRPLFLLKEIFQRPMENAKELLKRMGNPSDWFEICGPCSDHIDQAIEVQKKFTKLEERLKKIKKGLCQKLYNSHLQEICSLNVEAEIPNVIEKRKAAFRTEIRKMIPSIYEGHAFATATTEESFMSTTKLAPEVKTEVIPSETDLMDVDDEAYFDLEHVAESGGEQSGSEDHPHDSRWNSFIHVEMDTETTNPATVTQETQQHHPPSSSSYNPPPKKMKKMAKPRRVPPVGARRSKVVKKRLPQKQKRNRKPYYLVRISEEVAKKPDAPCASESQKFLAFEQTGRELAKVRNPEDASGLDDATHYLPERPLLRKREPVKRRKIIQDDDDDEGSSSNKEDELDEDFTIEGDEEDDEEYDDDDNDDGDDDEYDDGDENVEEFKRPRRSEKIRKRENIARFKSSVQKAKSLIRNRPESTENITSSINLSCARWKQLLDCGHELLDMNLITYPPTTAEEKGKIPEGFAESEIGAVHTEHGEKPFVTDFSCPSCGKYFFHKYFVISHIHRFHLGIRKHWTCNQCSKKFADARKVANHLKLHDSGEYISCPICKAFKSRSQKRLDYHVASHKKTVPNPACDICGKTYRDFNTFTHHMEVEHGVKFNYYDRKITVCELCSSTFRSDRSLKFHQVVSHGHDDEEGIFPICSQCGKPFKTAQSLELHIQRDHVKTKNFFCDQCGLGYAVESQLKTHVTNVHFEVTPITCHVCSFVVTNRKFFKRHMNKHHPEALKMSTDELEAHVKKLNEEKPHKCKLCDKQFAFSVFLYHHYRKEHEEVTDKYKCSVCGKGYSRACSVKRHYETVHEKKTAICQYCNKEIAASSLYQHLNTTKSCGAKRLAELEARNSTVVDNGQITTSSASTIEDHKVTPFLDQFQDDLQPSSANIYSDC